MTPDPEFTLSLRESGPVKQNISHDFLKRGNADLLGLQDLDHLVRCTGCQWKHRPGVRWFEKWQEVYAEYRQHEKLLHNLFSLKHRVRIQMPR